MDIKLEGNGWVKGLSQDKIRELRNDVHSAERAIEDAVTELLKKHQIASLGVSITTGAVVGPGGDTTTEFAIANIDVVLAKNLPDV
jgi:hypothetical protein